jgi:hypothetical protein
LTVAQDKETQGKENFLERWSRRKLDEAKPPAEKAPESEPPALPPLDQLTKDSEFSGFMHPKVEDALRRAALKKLFSDPHFNIPDPYEAYSGDWTVGEPIPAEMMATLNQARTLLFSEEEKKKRDEEEKKLAEENKPKPKDDEPGRQDT